MSDATEGAPAPAAPWQPLTFGGVASFAAARWSRLLVMELIVAALVSGSGVWFLNRAYCPIILQAIQKMPESARLVDGQLQGAGELTADSKFLAIAVTPEADREIGQGADLEIELRPTDFCAVSLFRPDWGLEFEYGKGASLNLSRSHLDPWWGAWRPMLLAAAAGGGIILLLISWAVLAGPFAVAAQFFPW